MNGMRAVEELNRQELELGVSIEGSWHNDYKDTAYIFIGGLPFDLSEGDILTIFSQYGIPVHLKLARDKDTGKSKGFAFLKYEDQRSTVLAVDNFNGAEILGRKIRVDHTRYKAPDDEEEDELKNQMGFDDEVIRKRGRDAEQREIYHGTRREHRRDDGDHSRRSSRRSTEDRHGSRNSSDRLSRGRDRSHTRDHSYGGQFSSSTRHSARSPSPIKATLVNKDADLVDPMANFYKELDREKDAVDRKRRSERSSRSRRDDDRYSDNRPSRSERDDRSSRDRDNRRHRNRSRSRSRSRSPVSERRRSERRSDRE